MIKQGKHLYSCVQGKFRALGRQNPKKMNELASAIVTEMVPIPDDKMRPIVRCRHFCTTILADAEHPIALYVDTAFADSREHTLVRTSTMRQQGCTLSYWQQLHDEHVTRWRTLGKI
jgi:hypothetical protein